MWPVTASRTVYDNDWMEVVEDDVVRPDGSPGVYGVVRLRREALSGMGIARLTSLVEAVHGHDALVIATGIEDPADIARVWGCGVDFIQGYFIKTAGETLDFDFSGTELL